MSSSHISAHDLRHQIALLACDLGLVIERLKGDRASAPALYSAVLERLDEGLAHTLALVEGRAAPSAAPAARAGQEALIEEIWDRFLRAGRLRADNSELAIEADAPLHFGPPAALHSLVLNLLANAVAAAPEGPVRLTVDRDALTLVNGGAPLPAHVLETLERGAAPAPQGGHGHGLGLILGAAAELDLAVEASCDRGETRFRLAPRSDGKPRLLLVEDDDSLRQMMTEFLRYDGYHVEARDRGDGLEPGAGRFAAVLADLNLPGLDGDLLLARWKRSAPDTLCILLTGESNLRHDTRPGVDHIVIKPGLTTLLELLAPLRETAP